MKKEDFFDKSLSKVLRIPNKDQEPFSWHMWQRLGLFEMSNSERVLMLKLNEMENVNCLLFPERRQFEWNRKDMTRFVKFIIPLILRAGETENLLKSGGGMKK